MRRVWLFSIVGALCAAASCWVFWPFDGDEVPMVPLQPARPIATATDGAATGGTATGGAAAEPATATTSPSQRDVVEPTRDERRPAQLEVLVRQDRQEGIPPHPIPGWEITVQVAAGPGEATATFAAAADASGVARFEVPGGDGREATVRCLGARAVVATLTAAAPLQVELRVVARLLVRGRVVDAAGRGVADAELVLLPWIDPDRHPPRLRRIGRSAGDGSFHLALPVGGRLAAQHPAHAPSGMVPVQAAVDPTAPPATTFVELGLLTAPGRAIGRVVDAAGAPVAQAEVEFRSAAPVPSGAVLAAPPQQVRTDEQGRFTVAHLRPGPIEHAARAAGSGSVRGTFEVQAGETARLEIRLPAACEVHGRVEDADGVPVAGCRVWSHALDAFDGAVAISEADGSFRLRDLPPGPVRLQAREGSSPLQQPNAQTAETRLELAPGQVGHWIATLRPPAAGGFLRGQVVDTDEARLPTWRVAVRHRDGAAQARTDSGGFFRVPLPGAGPVDVLVYAPDAPPGGFAHTLRRGVDPATEPLRITVDRRQPWGRVRGRVQTTAQGPLPAALVCWHHERQEIAQFRAGDDGTFDLAAVPPGTIDLHVEHPSHSTLSLRDLAVPVAPPLDLGTLSLEAGATLYGDVTGPDGLPPAELEVTLLTPKRLRGDYAAGVYRFATAPPGRHVLQVQGPTVAAETFVVELQAGVERRQDMRLEAGVARRFEVVVPQAADRVVSLALRRPEEAHTWLATAVVEDAVGNARAAFDACMLPGAYEAVAWAGADWEARLQVVFTPGDDGLVVLELVPR